MKDTGVKREKKRLFLGAKTYRRLFLIFSALTILFVSVSQLSVAVLSREGSRGQEVIEIQRKLTNLGLYTYKIDGIYGWRTTQAVRQFQSSRGLKVDGIAGPATLSALGISTTSSVSENDRNLLARAVYAEARGEPYEGKVAVAAVILNRVKSSSFPSSIAGVIYQPGAFSSVNDGQINLTPDTESYNAASDALNGWDPTNGCLYFYNPKKTSNAWMLSRPVVRTIGNHRFTT